LVPTLGPLSAQITTLPKAFHMAHGVNQKVYLPGAGRTTSRCPSSEVTVKSPGPFMIGARGLQSTVKSSGAVDPPDAAYSRPNMETVICCPALKTPVKCVALPS
jgi:hypothetical protein